MQVKGYNVNNVLPGYNFERLWRMDISLRLREAREALGKTQEQVAHDAGMHVTQYNGYERGRSRPAVATLERIASALSTTSAALVSPESAQPNFEAGFRAMREQFQAQIAGLLGVSPREVTVRIELG